MEIKINNNLINKRLLLKSKFNNLNEVVLLEISPNKKYVKLREESSEYWKDVNDINIVEVLIEPEPKFNFTFNTIFDDSNKSVTTILNEWIDLIQTNKK